MNQAIRNKFRPILYFILKMVTDMAYIFPDKRRNIPILVYHRVCPLYYKKELPYANVYPEEFDKQMMYLKNNFEVITILEYLQRLNNNMVRGSEVIITFDDGFKDNFIYAFPILKKHGLMATFFLTTKYIGTNALFPWMFLDKGAKDDMQTNLERWLPLSWEEVKEMMEYGMEFGTHTHTHKDSLSKMTLYEAKKEIEESTKTFKDKTGIVPEFFSYPHGTFKDYNATHIELLKLYNYKAAVTTNAGRNTPFQDSYELKRIIIYEEDSLWEFKKKVHGAYDIAETLQKAWLHIAGSEPYKIG